ncbi:protein-ADP-ribose hydrolase [Thomasclavelia spiroformis]|uniref:protein-ADP-ribose hydrolase n=1 Tax=Thomasclavelia spiroformis TaxID=29348 RepID=UPI0039963EB5
MLQQERRIYLIKELLKEQQEKIKIPKTSTLQKQLLRALFNIRLPKEASNEFLKIQDEYLQEEIAKKGITDYHLLTPIKKGIYLWQGDITTLCCDAIVNAANSQMLGCFYPNHGCIDNAIHSYAGIQLRLVCAKLMVQQGHEEATGKAKITTAFNLPSKYILHTVGPIIINKLKKSDCEKLRSCYNSCLKLASEKGLNSIAFCCISTGEFHFPNDIAAKIAIQTVYEYQKDHEIEVIFNVFTKNDYDIYASLLR